MITRNVNKLTFYQFQNLHKIQGLKHFTSTRLGGVSRNHLESLNLGYTVNDNPELVDKNLELLAEATQISKSCMVFPKQTNGTNIAIVKSVNDVFSDTDALITNIPGICIGVRTADCVPVIIYEPEKRIIAAVHSGWKGTVEKIAKNTIEIMVSEFGANPKKMIAGIGPSISPDVYEVGPDVINLVIKAFGNNHVLKQITGSEKALFDLWQANKMVLTESGIPESNIEIAEMCTFSNSDLFYSARRDKQKTGRLATGIMMV
ncbi:MAG: peptidoglycan editing factor PgeF [Bacteroidales bacterium]